VLGIAGKLTRVATIRSAWGRRLAMNLSGLSRREFARLPAASTPMTHNKPATRSAKAEMAEVPG
jgi:hypothetical protein